MYVCVYIKNNNFILGDVVPWCVYQLYIYFYQPTNTSVYIVYVWFYCYIFCLSRSANVRQGMDTQKGVKMTGHNTLLTYLLHGAGSFLRS